MEPYDDLRRAFLNKCAKVASATMENLCAQSQITTGLYSLSGVCTIQADERTAGDLYPCLAIPHILRKNNDHIAPRKPE